MLTVPAGAVNPANPGNSDSSTSGKTWRTSFDDLTHNLMTGNKPFPKRWEFAFDDVQVRPADAAGAHPQQNLPGRH